MKSEIRDRYMLFLNQNIESAKSFNFFRACFEGRFVMSLFKRFTVRRISAPVSLSKSIRRKRCEVVIANYRLLGGEEKIPFYGGSIL